MKKTFKEKIISHFRKVTNKHRWLKYPCILNMVVILFFYHLVKYFADNTKRFASVALVVLFFMSSCSFSFAVFAERTGFIRAQEEYSAVIGDSDIVLADNTVEVDTMSLLQEEAFDAKLVESMELTNADIYTADEIIETKQDTGENAEEKSNTATGKNTEEKSNTTMGKTADETAEEDESEITVTHKAYTFDRSDWRLVLVNKQHPIPEDYEFTLGNLRTIKGNMKCDERVIDDLLLMIQKAKADGINLAISSPYRDTQRQEYLFERKINKYMKQGMSYMDAYKISSQIVTIPGSSEHQIGLAFDITCDTYSSLDEGFGDTRAGKWLAEHSHEYGFTMRYPDGKEYITSIEYEPWHFRYVGREAATVMYEESLCLEEFWDKYL